MGVFTDRNKKSWKKDPGAEPNHDPSGELARRQVPPPYFHEAAKRRGAAGNTPNRFESIVRLPEPAESAGTQAVGDSSPLRILPTEVFEDASKSIVTENRSPDLPFRYSLNPYRGCEHGCTYCYARPTHETLGLSAGLDFETKILAKPQAPRLLKEFLRRSSYVCEPIVLSGVTDPYQPVERDRQITRQCLQAMIECGQPVDVISKSRLLLRDIDLLSAMARRNLARVSIAVTTLDEELQHAMEPRASSPFGRLDMMRQLSAAGVPVHLLIAPVIPGLTDDEIPAILKAAKTCGARSASYVMLRLPHAVQDIFLDWLRRTYPTRFPRVVSRIRQVRAGRLNDSAFGSRMKGTGAIAEEIAKMFRVFAKIRGLDAPWAPLDTDQFRPPADPSGQLTLF